MSLERIIKYQVSQTFHHSRFTSNDDLFQGCYKVALNALKQYKLDKNTKLKTFLTTCIRNYLADERRKQKIRVEELNACELDDSQYYEHDDFLLTMRQLLSKFQYEIFILHYCEDFSLKEIALAKGLKKQEVFRCSQRIRQIYQSNVLN